MSPSSASMSYPGRVMWWPPPRLSHLSAFQHLEGLDQRVGVLLAERVHMEALHARRQRVGEVCARDAETRIGRAGVVNRAGLRGVLRVDAQARAHARETRVKGLELPD